MVMLTLLVWRLHFFRKFHYLFLERGEGRDKERERNINVREKHHLVASHMHPDPGDWTLNPGMCPDQELNWGHFSLCGRMANQLSYISQGRRLHFENRLSKKKVPVFQQPGFDYNLPWHVPYQVTLTVCGHLSNLENAILPQFTQK